MARPRAANECGLDARHLHTDDAPLPEKAGCLAPDADVIEQPARFAAA